MVILAISRHHCSEFGPGTPVLHWNGTKLCSKGNLAYLPSLRFGLFVVCQGNLEPLLSKHFCWNPTTWMTRRSMIWSSGPWKQMASYVLKQIVPQNGRCYICVVHSHVSLYHNLIAMEANFQSFPSSFLQASATSMPVSSLPPLLSLPPMIMGHIWCASSFSISIVETQAFFFGVTIRVILVPVWIVILKATFWLQEASSCGDWLQ